VPDNNTAPDDHRVLASLQELLRDVVAPLEGELGPLPPASPRPDSYWEQATKVRRASAERGIFGAYMSPAAGGRGLGVDLTSLLVEEAGRWGLELARFTIGLPFPDGPSPLLESVTPELWTDVVIPVTQGHRTMCFAWTEPSAGSDLSAMTTTAVRDVDGWEITGVKHLITNADRADYAIVFAVTDPDRGAFGGMTAFLVPRSAYEVEEQHVMLGSVHTARIHLRRAQVPGHAVVGRPGSGVGLAFNALTLTRILLAAYAVGLGRFCLSQARTYATERIVQGKPLIEFQGVAFPLAQAGLELDAAWLQVRRAAKALDEENDQLTQASAAKLLATETAFRAADTAVQVLGGRGLMATNPIARAFCDLRTFRVVEGANEVHLTVLASELALCEHGSERRKR
jgi:acyl-CoA dehydrogenase